MKRILIDGDILIYKAGFSVETRLYVVSKDGVEQEHNSKAAALEDAKKRYGAEIFFERRAEPLRNAKANMDRILNRILRQIGSQDYTVILSSEDKEVNHRYKIAKTKPYKGNRSADGKPLHYKELRDHLLSAHGAVETKDGEGDDELGRLQGDSTIIASIDKDLLMIPGHHYNINTGDITISSNPGKLILKKKRDGQKTLTGYGFLWFCAQMLLGDYVDNIPGLPAHGSVRTYKALKDCKTAKEGWECVNKAYTRMKCIDRIDEIRQLLWIDQGKRFEEVLGENTTQQS